MPNNNGLSVVVIGATVAVGILLMGILSRGRTIVTGDVPRTGIDSFRSLSSVAGTTVASPVDDSDGFQEVTVPGSFEQTLISDVQEAFTSSDMTTNVGDIELGTANPEDFESLTYL